MGSGTYEAYRRAVETLDFSAKSKGLRSTIQFERIVLHKENSQSRYLSPYDSIPDAKRLQTKHYTDPLYIDNHQPFPNWQAAHARLFIARPSAHSSQTSSHKKSHKLILYCTQNENVFVTSTSKYQYSRKNIQKAHPMSVSLYVWLKC